MAELVGFPKQMFCKDGRAPPLRLFFAFTSLLRLPYVVFRSVRWHFCFSVKSSKLRHALLMQCCFAALVFCFCKQRTLCCAFIVVRSLLPFVLVLSHHNLLLGVIKVGSCLGLAYVSLCKFDDCRTPCEDVAERVDP